MSLITTQLDRARARDRLMMLQRQASSGRRIFTASDDPTSASAMVRLDSEIRETGQHQENITRAINELGAADAALGGMGDLLVRARELAIAMASEHYTAEERAVAAEEVRQLREQVMTLSNTRHDGVYIFGGYETETLPVDEATGALQGDDNIRRIVAAPGLEVEASVSAVDFLNPAGGYNVLGMLDQLATDLETNNVAGVSTATEGMRNAHAQMTEVRSRAGTRMDRLMGLGAIAEDLKISQIENRSHVADADMADTLSELVMAQQILNTTIQVSADVLRNLTLVGKL
jgi:flagellar hook-associated protein 3 FlgL